MSKKQIKENARVNALHHKEAKRVAEKKTLSRLELENKRHNRKTTEEVRVGKEGKKFVVKVPVPQIDLVGEHKDGVKNKLDKREKRIRSVSAEAKRRREAAKK